MKILPALVMAAALGTCAMVAAQTVAPTPLAPCPSDSELSHRHLLGLWRAEFKGIAQGATLLLEQHPETKEGLRGAINRNGERAQLAGDLEDGELELEESVNGVNISATWTGEVVAGTCAREIRGIWQPEGARGSYPFILRKQ